MEIINLILHLDQTLAAWSQWMGVWLYVVLFVIIFAETGLVITPFLPGDSLLFAVGALTSLENSPLDATLLSGLLMVAALLGDNLNYWMGRKIGPRLFSRLDSRFLNPKHLERTKDFYAQHGSRAIVIGRFMPIVRTFVPFVAGVGEMNYRKFLSMSGLGAFLWIQSFLWAGHFFGNLPTVKTHFHLVIFAVIFVSLLPLFYEALKARRKA